MSWTHRDATPDDAAALAALGARTFTETFGHLYKPEDLAAFLTQHTSENWGAKIADPAINIRIAEDGDTPAGYCTVKPLQLDYRPQAEPCLELSQLYLFSPWHGTGLADALMAWAKATARQRGAVELALSVYAENFRGQAFYRRHGFHDAGPTIFRVGNHIDDERLYACAL